MDSQPNNEDNKSYNTTNPHNFPEYNNENRPYGGENHNPWLHYDPEYDRRHKRRLEEEIEEKEDILYIVEDEHMIEWMKLSIKTCVLMLLL